MHAFTTISFCVGMGAIGGGVCFLMRLITILTCGNGTAFVRLRKDLLAGWLNDCLVYRYQ